MVKQRSTLAFKVTAAGGMVLFELHSTLQLGECCLSKYSSLVKVAARPAGSLRGC